jgi:hypothetical protein
VCSGGGALDTAMVLLVCVCERERGGGRRREKEGNPEKVRSMPGEDIYTKSPRVKMFLIGMLNRRIALLRKFDNLLRRTIFIIRI